MKKPSVFLLLIVIITSCQITTPDSDPVSIHNTAVAMAVAQTQSIGIISTANAQGTQIAILIEPTVAITPTQNLLMIEDNDIKIALLAVLGVNESGFYYSQHYNDGKLAIGYYSLQNVSTIDDGLWFAQRDSNDLWGIFYISRGIPTCKELQKFNFNNAITIQCLDMNGNQIMLWEWNGQ